MLVTNELKLCAVYCFILLYLRFLHFSKLSNLFYFNYSTKNNPGETVGRGVGVQQADEGGPRGTRVDGPVRQERVGRPQLQLRRHRQGVRHQEVS